MADVVIVVVAWIAGTWIVVAFVLAPFVGCYLARREAQPLEENDVDQTSR